MRRARARVEILVGGRVVGKQIRRLHRAAGRGLQEGVWLHLQNSQSVGQMNPSDNQSDNGLKILRMGLQTEKFLQGFTSTS